MTAIGSDHGGYKLKEEIKKYLDEKNIKYKDYGTYSEERTDYPIYGELVAEAVSKKEADSGILICKSGCGMTVIANKFKGVRAATMYNEIAAKHAKEDDDINVLTIGADFVTLDQAINVIRNWIAGEFKGKRYEDRLNMIKEIEQKNMK